MDLNWDKETLTMEEAIRRAIDRKLGGHRSAIAAGRPAATADLYTLSVRSTVMIDRSERCTHCLKPRMPIDRSQGHCLHCGSAIAPEQKVAVAS